MHARPACIIASNISCFSLTKAIAKVGDVEIDLNNVMSIMFAIANQNCIYEVTLEGQDETKAEMFLNDFFSFFDEDKLFEKYKANLKHK